ncbi:MAG: hypothetical protein GPOALKHO_000366 [Sodalis sp.]|nr:MAG: hypothetical protein GPOALKHO_000366 [Sodalis sp.]
MCSCPHNIYSGNVDWLISTTAIDAFRYPVNQLSRLLCINTERTTVQQRAQLFTQRDAVASDLLYGVGPHRIKLNAHSVCHLAGGVA